MPLIKYRQYIFNPGGDYAEGVEVMVHLCGGNVAVPLRADKSGTQPLPNPATTGEEGLLEFHAAPGHYGVWYGGTFWPLLVAEEETDPVTPDLFVHTQVTPATVWTVDHWFGTQPDVTVLVDGQPLDASITHPSATQTVITFAAPFTGVAHLRR